MRLRASCFASLALLAGARDARPAPRPRRGGTVTFGGCAPSAPPPPPPPPAAPARLRPAGRRACRARRRRRAAAPRRARRGRRGRRRPPSGPSAIAGSTSRTPSPAAPACSGRSTPRRARPASSASASSPSGSRQAFSARRSIPCSNPNGGAAHHERHDEPRRRHAVAQRLARQARRRARSTRTARSWRTRTATRRTSRRCSRSSATWTSASSTWRRSATSSTSASSRSSGSSTAPARSASTAAGRARSSAASARSTCAASRSHTSRSASASTPSTSSTTRPTCLGPTEARRAARRSTRIERYGLGVNRVDQFQIFIGGEAFLADERVRPFIEEKIGVPNNRQGYACQTNNPSKDSCLANDKVVPSHAHHRQPLLPVEARLLAARRGRHRHRRHEQLHRGAASPSRPGRSTSAPAGRSTRRTGRRSSRPRSSRSRSSTSPPHGHVVGFVHEKDKNDPIVGAHRRVPRPHRAHAARDRRRTASSPTTCRAGAVHVRHQGRRVQARARATRRSPRRAAAINDRLRRSRRCRASGIVDGHVRDADTSQPVAGVQVDRARRAEQGAAAHTDPSGGFKFDAVAPGTAQLSVHGRRLPRPRDADGREGPRRRTRSTSCCGRSRRTSLVTVGKRDHHQAAGPVRARQRGHPARVLRPARPRSPTRSSATPRSARRGAGTHGQQRHARAQQGAERAARRGRARMARPARRPVGQAGRPRLRSGEAARRRTSRPGTARGTAASSSSSSRRRARWPRRPRLRASGRRTRCPGSEPLRFPDAGCAVVMSRHGDCTARHSRHRGRLEAPRSGSMRDSARGLDRPPLAG